MNEELEAIAASTAQICGSLWKPPAPPDGAGCWAPEVWDALERAEFTLLPVPEEQGGAGAGIEEAAAVVRELGRWSVPVPLVETALLAGWVLSRAGLPVSRGPLTAVASTALSARQVRGGYQLSGRLTRVPYGQVAARLVVLADGPKPRVFSIGPEGLNWVPGRNLAGEPRDAVTLDDLFVPASDTTAVAQEVDGGAFRVRGALGTALLMAGAMETAVSSSVEYACQRVQFGRPIMRFQAVQQHLAEMAAESAATHTAVMAAAGSGSDGFPDPLKVAAAKVQAGRSASTVARLAHQVHGAMGFTQEHVLHHSTTRLWSWRDEFGTESDWSTVIGEAALESTGLWALVTGTTGETAHG